MVVAVEEKEVKTEVILDPKFRNPEDMTEEELTDPDYRKKRLARDFGNGNIDRMTCSKCHHCRR